jgi:hypothetical protein
LFSLDLSKQQRDSFLFSELIDAEYLHGVPFRDAAQGGMTTGVSVIEIKLKGRLFLEQLKLEKRQRSFRTRAWKLLLLVDGYILGIFTPALAGLVKGPISSQALRSNQALQLSAARHLSSLAAIRILLFTSRDCCQQPWLSAFSLGA